MALVKCDECGKEISDSAKKCPHCGIGTKEKDNSNSEKYDFYFINFIASNNNCRYSCFKALFFFQSSN